MLNTKIPPPIIFFIALMLVYLTNSMLGNFSFPSSYLPALALIGFGVYLTVSSARLFKRKQTTINPMKPEQASLLVTEGAFSFTRNPMYLGMLLVILAVSLYLGSIAGFLVALGFAVYIQIFQIRPEERVLESLFGEEYLDYCKRVRRWL